eukprot:4228268-Pleurochrysis_carterae.AAC.7
MTTAPSLLSSLLLTGRTPGPLDFSRPRPPRWPWLSSPPRPAQPPIHDSTALLAQSRASSRSRPTERREV